MIADEKNPPESLGRARASEDVLLARTRLYYALIVVAGIPVACLGLGLLTIMAVPLAHVIAGKHTDFALTISISFNAVLSAAAALSGLGLAIQASRARHHKRRARELERKILSHQDGTSSRED